MPEPDSEDELIHRHYTLLTNRDGGLRPRYMVCALYESEQARLGVDEALCGGPCAPDDAEELAIASADVDTKYRNVQESGGGDQLVVHALAFEDHPDTRSHHYVLRPDVFLPSSLAHLLAGNISERIPCHRLHHFVLSGTYFLCCCSTAAPSTYTVLAPLNPATTDLLHIHGFGRLGIVDRLEYREPIWELYCAETLLLASTLTRVHSIPQPRHFHSQLSTSGNTAGK
ncbi:hypothetical protein B0H14DRAFT_2567132 [Mycena olivaceomarginata]|nr:hypothetical protein B0H14DRAFT_2567132 [Mycena olivaceomarginata]